MTHSEDKHTNAMGIPEAETLEIEMKSSFEHEKFSFEIPRVSCSPFGSLVFVLVLTTCLHENQHILLIFVHKLFKRMVVDAYVYHKHCKSRFGTVAHLAA